MPGWLNYTCPALERMARQSLHRHEYTCWYKIFRRYLHQHFGPNSKCCIFGQSLPAVFVPNLFLSPDNFSLQKAQPGRIRFSSGRVRDTFSLFLSSKVSFFYNLMSFMRGEIVLGILKRFGRVEYQFMLRCQIHGK
jgi:hypothetical protein